MKQFDVKQVFSGVLPVCTCCNIVVAVGADKTTVEDHVIHGDCAQKLAIVSAIKNDLQPVIDMLPEGLFKGTNILDRLKKAYTVSAFKGVFHDLCVYLKSVKDLVAEKFSKVKAAIKAAVERSRIKNVLIPVMNF